MKRAVCIGGSLLALLTAAGIGSSTFVSLAAQAKATAPTVVVDPLWPKPFPQKNAWILGSVTGVAVDGQDHVWVVHRGVDSLQANEKGPTLEPWASSCCFARNREAARPRISPRFGAGIRAQPSAAHAAASTARATSAAFPRVTRETMRSSIGERLSSAAPVDAAISASFIQ